MIELYNICINDEFPLEDRYAAARMMQSAKNDGTKKKRTWALKCDAVTANYAYRLKRIKESVKHG